MRRRVEDDVPEALCCRRARTTASRRSAASEPGDDGWAYFLDLWTDDGPARLHLEGERPLIGRRPLPVSLNESSVAATSGALPRFTLERRVSRPLAEESTLARADALMAAAKCGRRSSTCRCLPLPANARGALASPGPMDLSLFFAGTAGSVPTPRRGLPALLLRAGGERILFDCGEGTQHQLLRSGRAAGHRRDLHHPPAPRPLARAAGDDQDVRHARPRPAAGRLRPARPQRALPAGRSGRSSAAPSTRST